MAIFFKSPTTYSGQFVNKSNAGGGGGGGGGGQGTRCPEPERSI